MSLKLYFRARTNSRAVMLKKKPSVSDWLTLQKLMSLYSATDYCSMSFLDGSSCAFLLPSWCYQSTPSMDCSASCSCVPRSGWLWVSTSPCSSTTHGGEYIYPSVCVRACVRLFTCFTAGNKDEELGGSALPPGKVMGMLRTNVCMRMIIKHNLIQRFFYWTSFQSPFLF